MRAFFGAACISRRRAVGSVGRLRLERCKHQSCHPIGAPFKVLAPRPFQDCWRSPHDSLHGLYRALILAHGERVTWLRKCDFTREYGHASSLLIMVCF